MTDYASDSSFTGGVSATIEHEIPPSVQSDLEATVSKIEQHLAKMDGVIERRSSPRVSWLSGAAVWFEHEPGSGQFRQMSGVTTHDLSAGGFSFISSEEVSIESHIRLRLDILPATPVLYGRVISCQRLGGMHCRVSVQFVGVEGA